MDDICPRQCLLLSSDTNLHGCLQHPGRTACIETLAVAGMSAATLILCLVQIVAAIRGKLQQRSVDSSFINYSVVYSTRSFNLCICVDVL
eukprot:m.100703 g.100703  ORF g.100703 m.100703 type:complete len:90 (-) comp15635_c0_seq3:1786-2055(-)